MYTLEHLLKDCQTQRGRMLLPAKEKKEIFEQVWQALNAWILDRFEQGKGVNIGNFGKITWEQRSMGRNQQKFRPVFIIAESFCKTHGLPYKRPLIPPVSAPVEEINFTKLAIKFSTQLTKDLMFTGVRDLFVRLGEAIGSGKRVAIDFSIGKFISKNRVMYLSFDPQCFPKQYLAQATPSVVGRPPSAIGDLDDYQLDFDPYQEDEEEGNDTLQESMHENNATISEEASFPSNSSELKEFIRVETPISLQQNSLKDLILQKDVNTESDHCQSDYDVVLHAAYERHLSKLQREMEMDAIDAIEVHKKHFADVRKIQEEKYLKKKSAEELKGDIQQQMRQRQEDKVKSSNEDSNSGIAECVILPWSPREDKIAALEKKGIKIRAPHTGKRIDRVKFPNKLELKQKLDQQISDKLNTHSTQRQQNLLEEAEFLSKVTREIDEDKEEKLQKLKEYRMVLTKAWERDSHVKNMIKMRKQEITQKLIKPAQLGQNVQENYSIGFDIRAQ